MGQRQTLCTSNTVLTHSILSYLLPWQGADVLYERPGELAGSNPR